MSVSKSVTSAVCGALVERGLLQPDGPRDRARARAGRHVASRAARCGTCWTCAPGRGSTRTTRTSSADVRVYEQIYLWRPRTEPTLARRHHRRTTRRCRTHGPHGGPFDYRSVLTDVLGVGDGARGRRAPGRPDLPRAVAADGRGVRRRGHGGRARQRDGRRRRLLHAPRPRAVRAAPAAGRTPGQARGRARGVDPRHAVPRARRDRGVRARRSTRGSSRAAPSTATSSGSWTRTGPVYMGSGINGQTVLVHGPAQVVVAKFSTWPQAWTAKFSISTRKALVGSGRAAGGRPALGLGRRVRTGRPSGAPPRRASANSASAAWMFASAPEFAETRSRPRRPRRGRAGDRRRARPRRSARRTTRARRSPGATSVRRRSPRAAGRASRCTTPRRRGSRSVRRTPRSTAGTSERVGAPDRDLQQLGVVQQGRRRDASTPSWMCAHRCGTPVSSSAFFSTSPSRHAASSPTQRRASASPARSMPASAMRRRAVSTCSARTSGGAGLDHRAIQPEAQRVVRAFVAERQPRVAARRRARARARSSRPGPT